MKDQIYNLIDDYLEGKLSGSQLKEFEEHLQTNSNFNKEVELYRKVKGEITAKDLHFMQILEEVDQEYHANQSSPKSAAQPIKNRLFHLLALAASLLLLLFLCWYLLPQNNNKFQPIAVEIYTPYSSPMSDGTNNDDDLFKQASEFWHQKNYTQARRLFTNFISQSDSPEDRSESHLNIVATYLMEGNIDAAKIKLKALLNDDTVVKSIKAKARKTLDELEN